MFSKKTNGNKNGELYHNFKEQNRHSRMQATNSGVVAFDNDVKIIYDDSRKFAGFINADMVPHVFENNKYIHSSKNSRRAKANNQVAYQKNETTILDNIKDQIFEETYKLLGIKHVPDEAEVDASKVPEIPQEIKTGNEFEDKMVEVAATTDPTILNKIETAKKDDSFNNINKFADFIKNDEFVPKDGQQNYEPQISRDEINAKQEVTKEEINKQFEEIINNERKIADIDEIFIKPTNPNVTLFKENAPFVDASQRVGSTPDLKDSQWEKVKEYVKEFNTRSYAEVVGNVPGIVDVDNAIKVDLNDRFYLNQDQLDKNRQFQNKQFNSIITEYYDILEKQQAKSLQDAFDEINRKEPFVFNNEKNINRINKQNEENIKVIDENTRLKQEIKELERLLLKEPKVPVLEEKMSKLQLEDSIEVLEPKAKEINNENTKKSSEPSVDSTKNSLDDLLVSLNKELNIDEEEFNKLINEEHIVNVLSKNDAVNKKVEELNESKPGSNASQQEAYKRAYANLKKNTINTTAQKNSFVSSGLNSSINNYLNKDVSEQANNIAFDKPLFDPNINSDINDVLNRAQATLNQSNINLNQNTNLGINQNLNRNQFINQGLNQNLHSSAINNQNQTTQFSNQQHNINNQNIQVNTNQQNLVKSITNVNDVINRARATLNQNQYANINANQENTASRPATSFGSIGNTTRALLDKNRKQFNQYTNSSFANETDDYIRGIKQNQVNLAQQDIHQKLDINNLYHQTQYQTVPEPQYNKFVDNRDQYVNVISEPEQFNKLRVVGIQENRAKIILNTLRHSRMYAQSSSYYNSKDPFNSNSGSRGWQRFYPTEQPETIMSLSEACKIKRRPY